MISMEDIKEKTLLNKFLGDSPIIRIVDAMLEFRGNEVTQKEIYEEAEISRPTLHAYLPILEKHGVVIVTRKIGNNKLYKIDVKNKMARYFINMEKELVFRALNDASQNHQKIPIKINSN